jgi:uncharacterized membrane protein
MSEILSLLKEFDIGKILPPTEDFISSLGGWLRLFLLIGPLVLAGLGAWYYFAPPDEANYAAGYRSKWSMSSVAVWRFAQNLAGKWYMIGGGALALIMLIVSLFFGVMEPITMVVTAMICLLVEVAAILGLHLWIEWVLRQRFDQNGKPIRRRNSR